MFFALSGNSGVGRVSLGKEAPWCFDRPVNETPLGWEWLSKIRMVGYSGGGLVPIYDLLKVVGVVEVCF